MHSMIPRCVAVLFLLTGSLWALDKVRVETRSDQAASKYGLSGKGVIFAMIDRGIEFQNKDFQNADGTTRIAYIFDLTDNTGANDPANPYGKGTIYTQDQINQALKGKIQIPERDYLGHGTANTAIVAGNGANVAKYHGIAPEATIITVKVVNDGTPAHGDTPAVPRFFDPSLYATAVQFIQDKVKELNMPCVIVLDQGTTSGPADGTSQITRLIDATVGNQPGMVFVVATGDDGGTANHAAGNVPKNGSLTVKFQQGDPGVRFEMWYSGADEFDITVKTPDKTYGPFSAPSNNSADFRPNLGELSYNQWGANVFNPSYSMNGKREVIIDFAANAPKGEYAITLAGKTITSGHFDAVINPSWEWDASVANFFENLAVPGSLADYGTAHNAVTDACYVIRTSWTDVNGNARSLSNQGNVGEIWKGQSNGPTWDGRLGIDVAAPAEQIFTAYDPNAYWATSNGVEIQDGLGFYGGAGANSSSNPVTAGIIALMLQMNPKLDSFTVKDILHKSARKDSFTGNVPNTVWGYGKIDALSALDLMHNTKQPVINTLVNGASFTSGAVAPGQMFTIFGANLGPATLAYHDDLSWDLRFIGAINGTEVLFDGVPAAMIYTSAGQIAGVVPYAVAGKGTTSVVVQYEGVASKPVSVSVTDANPAFFMAPVFSNTQVAAINADGNHNSSKDPEKRGNTLVMFATGEGQTTPAGVDGALALKDPLPKPNLPVSVTVGGMDATVSYYGAAPEEIAGVMQLNVEIPANAPTGSAIPVVLKIGNTASTVNTTIAVR